MTMNGRLLLAALLLLAGPAFADKADAPADESFARLLHASPDVTIKSKAGARPGKSGDRLAKDEFVTTGEKAFAVIALPDGSRLKLRGSTRVVVALPGPKSSATEVFLSFGSVFAKVTKRLSGQKFNLRTRSAVAAVRGTEFFTAYGKSKTPDLWVCVNEGAVELKTKKSKEGMLVPAGMGVLIKGGLELTEPKVIAWTKGLNWNMDPEKGEIEDKTTWGGKAPKP